mgnify:CR=1 FL=1
MAYNMNMRFVIVGISLAIILAVAAIVGSPAGPVGIDAHR